MIGGPQIRIHDEVEQLISETVEHLVACGTGIVDQDVDLAELLISMSNQRMGLIEINRIRDQGTGLAALLGDQFHGLGSRVTIDIVHDHRGPITGQPQSRGSTDTPAGARNDRDSAVENPAFRC